MQLKGRTIEFTLRGTRWQLGTLGIYRNGHRVHSSRVPVRVWYVVGLAQCGEAPL